MELIRLYEQNILLCPSNRLPPLPKASNYLHEYNVLTMIIVAHQKKKKNIPETPVLLVYGVLLLIIDDPVLCNKIGYALTLLHEDLLPLTLANRVI